MGAAELIVPQFALDRALKTPRDVKRVMQAAEVYVLASPEAAAECFYEKPAGNGVVEGPSIRLAEVLAQLWGNLVVSTRIVSEGQSSVLVEGIAIDLETNTIFASQVQRSVMGKSGRYSSDMVATTIMAAQAIARRNVIFGVIPQVVYGPLYERAHGLVLSDVGEIREARAKAFAVFQKRFGVGEAQILEYLSRKNIGQVTAKDIVRLRGVMSGILQEGLQPSDYFPGAKPFQGHVAAEADAAPAAAPEPAPTEAPGEMTPRQKAIARLSELLDAAEERQLDVSSYRKWKLSEKPLASIEAAVVELEAALG